MAALLRAKTARIANIGLLTHQHNLPILVPCWNTNNTLHHVNPSQPSQSCCCFGLTHQASMGRLHFLAYATVLALHCQFQNAK
jgi:hypothetical protein